MKIALIHHQYAKKGGMESYLVDLVHGFAESGDQVDLITSKVDPETPGLEHCVLYKNDVSLIPKPFRMYFFSRWLGDFTINRGYDLSLSVSRTSAQDIVVCGGTHRGFLRAMQIRPGLRDRLEIKLERQAYESSNRIMAHSRLMKNEIVELYGIDPSKIFVLYPPLDYLRFAIPHPEKRAENRARYGIHPDKTTLLFPSTGHERKGLDMLLKAFALLPETEFGLLIAGAPPRGKENRDNIRYLGFVGDMEKLYSAVDFTILPSYYEPFGLVVVESVQCGTPAIISNIFGASEILSDQECLIIPTLTPDGIAETIRRAVGHPFDIQPGFAERHQLTREEHIHLIKEQIPPRRS
ncbi:MAG: glycosyltransferase family 4 protein [candidate division Zixibacteria bacterium]|nr:glycosyltransferase family 4 protein [candidate division Zixibacteria bacterium]